MKNTLKNIACSCKKATFLIEKKQISTINIQEKQELNMHLAGCPECRIFEQQSIMIDQLVYELFHKPKLTGGSTLDEDFKKKMQHQISEKIKEK